MILRGFGEKENLICRGMSYFISYVEEIKEALIIELSSKIIKDKVLTLTSKLF